MTKKAGVLKEPKELLGERTEEFKKSSKARKGFRQYTVTFSVYDEEKKGTTIKNKKFKFLKEARIMGLEKYRSNSFISLYNHNGVPLCL